MHLQQIVQPPNLVISKVKRDMVITQPRGTLKEYPLQGLIANMLHRQVCLLALLHPNHVVLWDVYAESQAGGVKKWLVSGEPATLHVGIQPQPPMPNPHRESKSGKRSPMALPFGFHLSYPTSLLSGLCSPCCLPLFVMAGTAFSSLL